MLQAMLDLLVQRPETLLEGIWMPNTSAYEALVQQLKILVPLLADENETIRSLTSSIVRSLTTEDFLASHLDPVEATSYDFYSQYFRLT